MPATYALNRGFDLRRSFDVPPEPVFAAWTDPAELGWFFNPDNPVDEPATVDLRIGGQWRLLMAIDAGNRYITGGLYSEIERPGRLAFFHGAVGGWPALDLDRPEDCPLCSVTITPTAGGSDMEFRCAFPDHFSGEQIGEWLAIGVVQGWTMTIDRLGPALRAMVPARA